MRNTLIFAGSSCPVLTHQICDKLGMTPALSELTHFSNGETSVRMLTSVREKDVFIVQSGSHHINDTIMELLIMISACKGGSANKITAVVPYFPYSRQSKRKSQRAAITARMLANLLYVAGVKHVITVDLHASQMQGFFKCPVDNLHAEPLIARWIRHNIPNWKEGVVVSKNAGGTKRVASLADALKLNIGIVTTDKKRVVVSPPLNPSLAMLTPFDASRRPQLEFTRRPHNGGRPKALCKSPLQNEVTTSVPPTPSSSTATPISPQPNSHALQRQEVDQTTPTSSNSNGGETVAETDRLYDDGRADDVTHGRLVQGHIVDDDFPSPSTSADTSVAEIDPMSMSHASSFFSPQHETMNAGAEAEGSDEEEEKLQDPKIEHKVTLVGDVRNRPVFIVDDMIDKPGSWIAAAETVVKRGGAKKVYCMATHGVFGGDCLEQLQACDCIDAIIVTNSFPISEEQARSAPKLIVLDLSFLLAESIRRNHYGETISPLFQHVAD